MHDAMTAAVSRLGWQLAAVNVVAAATRMADLLRKANFDPNQPRVPRGDPRGGEWAKPAAGSGAEVAKPATAADAPAQDKPAMDLLPPFGDVDIFLPTVVVTLSGEERIHLPDTPAASGETLPVERPTSLGERYRAAKLIVRVASFLIRLTPPGRLVSVFVDAALWIGEIAPYAVAYFDGPQTLEQLRTNARERKRGYDVHHIVEQVGGSAAGFTDRQLDAPENRVRIPTLKHWELNRWYETGNDDYGGLTPRAFLRTQDSWQTHSEVGEVGLRFVGVLH